MSRCARGWSHIAWGLRHPVKAVAVTLAAIPSVRRHVLCTTAIADHPMHRTMRRAQWAEWEAKGLIAEDHPAGCFYGSFAGAYPDKWHIPAGADCPLNHGPDPILLAAAEDTKP